MKTTSIILNSYNPNLFHSQMTMACLAAIRKFTDRADYELIVIDNAPKNLIRDEYKVLKLEEETYVKNDVDKGVYAAYNQGAALAQGDYLVFIQSDVFVTEGWLPRLRWYLEHGWDVAYPQQLPLSREQVQTLYSADPDTIPFGQRDAGLLMITRDGFAQSGGWDERYHVLGEANFYYRLDQASLRWTCQTPAIITHIMAATNFSKDPAQFDQEQGQDAHFLQEIQ